MPTLNEYADGDGYYIRARPSDAGNITYQLKPEGEEIIEKVGYQDGEELGWQVISALRVPNLIYTGDKGTTNSDFQVEIKNQEIGSLTPEGAERLLDELAEVRRVSDSQIEEIEDILGISNKLKLESRALRKEIVEVLHRDSNLHQRVPNIIGDNHSEGKTDRIVTVRIIDRRDIDDVSDDEPHFMILILGESGTSFNEEVFRIQIGFSQNTGIQLCVAGLEEELTHELVAEYRKLMADILSTIIPVLESAGVEVGPPESLPPARIKS